jgi:SNF2 family DNA or RNA helicase
VKYTPKTKPFPHQSRATIQALKARNYAIFMEPRLGKSKVALDYCGVLALKGEISRVLIVAPRIAIEVWEKQIEQHFPYRAHCETFDEEWWTKPTKFITGTNPRVDFFLVSREETWNKTKPATKKMKELERWRPDVVIFDESHEYKRPGARGAQRAWGFIKRLRKRRKDGMPHVLLLTGTPNPKGWVDLFAQFRLMDDTIFGTNATEWKDRHVVYGRGKRKWSILKYNHEDEIEKKVRAHSISVNAEETGLANVQFFETIKVELPDKVKRMYLELAEEFMVEWEGGLISAANAGVKRLRLLQLCGGFTTDGTQIHGNKVAAIRAYLSLLHEQGESVVVYSRFTPEVEACSEALESVGYRSFLVDGGTSRKDRSLAINSLAKIPSTPTAISFQHQAGSRAIELVGAAETVYYSPPDGWVDYYQTAKRTQGPNQKRPVRYNHLVVPGTVDISVIRSLQRKEDGHAELMNNPRRYLAGL